MFRVAVFTHHVEISDTYLQGMSAFGADALDFGGWKEMPGVKETGLPDLEQVKALRKRVRSFGLENRTVSPFPTSQRPLSTAAKGPRKSSIGLVRRYASMVRPNCRLRANACGGRCLPRCDDPLSRQTSRGMLSRWREHGLHQKCWRHLDQRAI